MGEQAGRAPLGKTAATIDQHSQSNPQLLRVRSLALDLTVDFSSQSLRGVAELSFERTAQADEATPLVLDTRGLQIDSVESGKQPVKFTLSPNDPVLGAALSIQVPAKATSVVIRYQTTKNASALQWLKPEQTAGKKQPFLFTQSQAIHSRSWIPLQDSPGARITYTATIRVPKGLRAVMSADRVGEEAEGSLFRFNMPQPIAPYLIALAVGDLAFQELGPRTGVFAEPSVLPKAHAEFTDTEAMLQAAERLFGPYRWGRYDILVLPPSFPFGGMENPKVTFATPTILAGDKSLVALVAHEMAHSWSGNLVTNATWRDFWLNEGFTVYFERRIIEEIFGTEREAMEAVLGLETLKEELKELAPKDQLLHIDLTGRDPDEAVTQVAYEKGALLLKTIETLVGRPAFDTFLRRYFDEHAFQSLTTDQFVAYLRTNLLERHPEVSRRINLDAWLKEPGLPTEHFTPTSNRLREVDAAAARWVKGDLTSETLPARGWNTFEWLQFLGAIPVGTKPEKLADLDSRFQLSRQGNNEILEAWLRIGLRENYGPAWTKAEEFLLAVGRRKYLMPLYGQMIKTPSGKLKAKAIYAKARPGYHPIAVDSVDKLLNWP